VERKQEPADSSSVFKLKQKPTEVSKKDPTVSYVGPKGQEFWRILLPPESGEVLPG
jgi:hypothetical protein